MDRKCRTCECLVNLLRASTNIACTSATDEYNAYYDENRETCGSYLTTMSPINEELGGIGYWTMNVFSESLMTTTRTMSGLRGSIWRLRFR